MTQLSENICIISILDT